MNLTEQLYAHYRSQRTPREPDGKWHFSSLGGCHRKIIMTQAGFEQAPLNDQSLVVFRQGDRAERDICKALAALYTCSFQGKVELPELNAKGTFDVFMPFEHWVLDVKTTNGRGWGYIPKENYRLQVTGYAMALNRLTPIHRTSILYEDKEFGRMALDDFPWRDYEGQVTDEFRKLEEEWKVWNEQNELPRERQKRAGGLCASRYCQLFNYCNFEEGS